MPLNESQADELADMFRLLGDGGRLRIMLSLCTQRLCVGDLANHLDLSPSLASHHLRLLKAARLVRSEKEGKQVFYTAADIHIINILKDMADHITECPDEEEST